MQALRAARNAGITVPKSVIDRAQDYLKKCTTARGGIIYSLAQGGQAGMGGERPALTAAAIACSFNAGQYDSPLARRWLEYCRAHLPDPRAGRTGQHDEYLHYYYAQALYCLGNDGYRRLFPQSRELERLTWAKYRQGMFDQLVASQSGDGSWTGGYIGPVFTTAVHLTILQLDNGTLPIYQR
jgi:hypothetical protein